MSLTAGSFRWYSSALQQLGTGAINLVSDDLKIALLSSSYTPNAAHQYFDVHITDELSNGNGYTSGGQSLTSKAWISVVAGTWKLACDNCSWTAGASDLVARYWVCYDNTPASSKPLLAYGHLNYNAGTPLDVTAAAGTDLSLLIPADGLFYATRTDNQ